MKKLKKLIRKNEPFKMGIFGMTFKSSEEYPLHFWSENGVNMFKIVKVEKNGISVEWLNMVCEPFYKLDVFFHEKEIEI